MYKEISDVINSKKEKLTGMSDKIWGMPETAFTEFETV